MESRFLNSVCAFRGVSRKHRAVAIASGLFLIGVLAWVQFRSTKSVIVVDGKPVVCVPSERDAEEVLHSIKCTAGCDPSEIEFRQSVVVARAPRDARPVSRHRALNLVRTVVSPVFCRWAIIVDGVPRVALPSRHMAGEVLDLARLKFGMLARNLAEEPQFKENVKVDMAAVSPEIFRKTPDAALDLLFAKQEPKFEEGTYVVKKGDIACVIASRHGIELEELKVLNPGTTLDRLQIGDTIRIKAAKVPKPKLTVIVRDLSVRVEPMPPPVRRISSAKLYAGKTTLVSPGRRGSHTVKAALIYENGRKVGSEVIEEQITEEPSPRIVAVGIKPRPTW